MNYILTKDQQLVVNKLVNEFVTLNEKKSEGKFNLLDYNALNNDLNRQKKGEKELRIYNDSMKGLMREAVIVIANRLNEDIANGKLPLYIETSDYTVYIRNIKYKDKPFVPDSHEVLIHLGCVTEMSEFGGKIISYGYSPSLSIRILYSDVMDLINTTEVQYKLKYMIKKGS